MFLAKEMILFTEVRLWSSLGNSSTTGCFVLSLLFHCSSELWKGIKLVDEILNISWPCNWPALNIGYIFKVCVHSVGSIAFKEIKFILGCLADRFVVVFVVILHFIARKYRSNLQEKLGGILKCLLVQWTLIFKIKTREKRTSISMIILDQSHTTVYSWY